MFLRAKIAALFCDHPPLAVWMLVSAYWVSALARWLKVEIARRRGTSQAAVDRLLDPGDSSVTLQSLCRAAGAIGRDLRIELV